MHRIAIVGGGLAGLATARALTQRGLPPEAIVVVDADDPARGSNSPCGMLHAFPGRSLEPETTTFDKLHTSLQWVRSIADATPHTDADALHAQLPMVRPLARDDRGRQMHNSWETHRHAYPDWFDSTWLTTETLSRAHPGIHADLGAVRYTPAMVVRIDHLRRSLARQLARHGCEFVGDTSVNELQRDDERWVLHATDRTVAADRVIFACGARLDDWFDLPAGPKAGEVLVVEPDSAAPELHAAVSGGGYVAPIPPADDAETTRWLVGATWFQPGELDERSDDDAIETIRQKTDDFVPAVQSADVIDVWRGVRFMLGHISGPLVGAVPTLPDTFVAGAFGSKGLLRIPHAARQLAARLTDADAPIVSTLRANRIDTRWWDPNPARISH